MPSFINYTPYYVFRSDQGGGGLAILARNDLCVEQLLLDDYVQGVLEVQAVVVHGFSDKISILNLYNPVKPVTAEEFDFYFQQLKTPSVVVGDFNAHHGLWSSKQTTNATGRNLVSALFDFPDLCLLTPKDYRTYFHVPTRQFSTLDLCFLSSELFTLAQLASLDDLGGDHIPLMITLNFSPVFIKVKSRKRWIFGGPADWNEWRSKLGVLVSDGDLACNYDSFVSSLIDTSADTFKMTSGCPNSKCSKVWWSATCATLVAARKGLKNKFRYHPTTENLILLRQTEARV